MDRDDFGHIILLIFVIIILVGGIFGLTVVSCDARTASIGYPHKYDLFGGCLIEVKDGQWIPLENYYFRE